MKQAGIVEIYELKRRGCEAEDWSKIIVSDTFDPCRVKNVHFIGKVTLGAVKELSNAIIEDCRLSDGCVVRNVQGYLKGLDIGRDVTIIDAGSIEMEPAAASAPRSRCLTRQEADQYISIRDFLHRQPP